MLAVIAPYIEEVRQMVQLLTVGFPDDALRIADALADDNRDHGNLERAELWSQIAIEVAARQAIRVAKPDPI